MLSGMKRFFKKEAPPDSLTIQDLTSDSNTSTVHQAAGHPTWTSDIPREIIFQIIDTELDDNISALQCLSLTCRILHIYTQRCIFRRVAIYCGVRGPSSISKFLATIGHSPSVLSCIQDLELVIHVYPHTLPKEQLEDIQSIAFVLQQPLPRLRSLRVKLDTWIQQSSESSSKLKQTLINLLRNNKITHLTLRGRVAFDMEMLRYADHVIDLNFQDLADMSADDTPNLNSGLSLLGASSRSMMRPRTISLYAPQSRESVALSAQHQYCDLSAVTAFRFYGKDTPFFVPPYLKVLSSSLIEVNIYCPNSSSSGVSTPIPALDLSALSRLRHLVITIHVEFNVRYIPSETEWTTQFEWLINSLVSLPIPCAVTSVKLLIGSNSFSQSCNSLDWERFDNLVFGMPRKWEHLRSLEMLFFTGFDRNQKEFDFGSLNADLMHKLQDLRGIVGAALSTKFELGMSIWDYLPDEMQ